MRPCFHYEAVKRLAPTCLAVFRSQVKANSCLTSPRERLDFCWSRQMYPSTPAAAMVSIRMRCHDDLEVGSSQAQIFELVWSTQTEQSIGGTECKVVVKNGAIDWKQGLHSGGQKWSEGLHSGGQNGVINWKQRLQNGGQQWSD